MVPATLRRCRRRGIGGSMRLGSPRRKSSSILWPCQYRVKCTAAGCQNLARVIVRRAERVVQQGRSCDSRERLQPTAFRFTTCGSGAHGYLNLFGATACIRAARFRLVSRSSWGSCVDPATSPILLDSLLRIKCILLLQVGFSDLYYSIACFGTQKAALPQIRRKVVVF